MRRTLLPSPLISLLALVLWASVPASQVPAAARRDESRVAARGGGREIGVARLEGVLLDRYGLDEVGRDVLKGMLDLRVVETLAREAGLTVSEKEVEQKLAEIERAARAAGLDGGLEHQLREQGVDPDVFRRQLPLAILHEKLTRRALELADDAPVGREMQSLWLAQAKQELGGQEILNRPWQDGIVARCGEAVVLEDEFGEFLWRQLRPDEVRLAAWHCLLLDSIRARMVDVSDEALQREVELEIERRRRKQERETPDYGFEQVLAAQGRTLDLLRRDPSVQIAALARIWVDREAGPQGLRETYERERAYFEGLYGEAVLTHFLFLIAARFKNDLIRRTYEEADQTLADMLRPVQTTDDFAAMCAQYSEHSETRDQGGSLGWVTRGNERIPEVIRSAIFDHVARSPELPTQGTALGPLRLGNPSGSAMLWVSAVRPSPSWEVMSRHVHDTLRGRFLESMLSEDEVEVLPR